MAQLKTNKVDVIVNSNSLKMSQGPVSFSPLLHKCFLYILGHVSTKNKSYYHVKFSSVLNFETTSHKVAKIFNFYSLEHPLVSFIFK